MLLQCYELLILIQVILTIYYLMTCILFTNEIILKRINLMFSDVESDLICISWFTGKCKCLYFSYNNELF